MLSLESPVQSLAMVGATYAYRLKKLGIVTVGDLLYHVPFRYEDFSIVSKIGLLQPGEAVSVIGEVKSIDNIYTKHGKKIQKATVADETGEMEVVWYNQPFLLTTIKPGVKLIFAGQVKTFGQRKMLESPDYEFSSSQGKQPIHTARLVPVYPETYGVSSKWLRSRISSILSSVAPHIHEFLPVNILRKFHLLGEAYALSKVHFPPSLAIAWQAKRRLSFDELLLIQLAGRLKRNFWQNQRVGLLLEIEEHRDKINQFISKLPFKLTFAQEKAVADILHDLKSDQPMNRLLEGDVGSGKTVVATIAMYAAYLSKTQSILMAPTEILAYQHYQTITNLLKDYGIGIALVTKTSKPNVGTYDIFVGTHALLFDFLQAKNVSLVIVDEQQRFGVEQRAKLRSLGHHPHLLSMTATPIPRSIAMTLYADLDLSLIDEMPKGRLPIKTWVVPPEKRLAAYSWIREQVTNSLKKQQAFIICPFIDESESLTSVKAVKKEFDRLQGEVYPDLRLGLLHGKMKPKEKSNVLSAFHDKKLDILVATPVVEVGIDIPDAAIMMIEGADRFGLAQLHQLRGRVGRSDKQSYCLLFTDSTTAKTITRLKYLEYTFNGPKLAEYDLKLRGSGEIFGTKQHGRMDLKIADLSDVSLLSEAKEATQIIMGMDKTLRKFPLLRQRLQPYTMRNIAPD